MPGLDQAGKHQGSQDKRQNHHGVWVITIRVRRGIRSAIDAPEQVHHQQRRQPSCKTDVAQVGCRAGQLIDKIPLGSALHPGSEQRDHLSEEPQPVIGVL